MPQTTPDHAEAILAAIRRVVRAIDLNTKQLVRDYGVTGPQLVALRAIAQLGPIGVTNLAREINLSQPTVTGILSRLEQQGLILRERGNVDRRAVTSTITKQGTSVLRETPILLEERFRRELARLQDWEQAQTLSSLQRVAAMMEAEDIPAVPILATEPPTTAVTPLASDPKPNPTDKQGDTPNGEQ